MNARVQFRDLPATVRPDADRVSFLDSQKVYMEFGEKVNGMRRVKPGQVAVIYGDELGFVACVETHTLHCTSDHDFATLRQAIDFAMEKAGL